MKDYFDYKLAYDGITVRFWNAPSVEEREMHSYHELLYCENANTVLHTESQKIELRGEGLFIIPKGKYHSFDLSGVDEFARLKIAISEEAARTMPIGIFSSDVCIVSSVGHGIRLLLSNVCRLMSGEVDAADEFYVYCAVKMLIAELNTSKTRSDLIVQSDKNGNEVIRSVIKYISEHLSDDLSVKTLARLASISPSSLTHEFHKELGISLHKYIVQKRMIYARGRMDLGEQPCKIYMECGYNDYSSFYKAYLKFFGEAPSEKKR